MVKSWNQIFAYLLRNAASDPDKKRKGQILSILLLGTSLIWIVITVVDTVGIFLHPQLRNEYIFGTDIISAVMFYLAWAANRRGRIRIASYTYLLFMVIASLIFFPTESLNEVMIIFSIPIMIASFLIRPDASFFFAFLCTASYTAIYLDSPRTVDYNYVSVPIFFLIALLAWLVASRLEHALVEASQREEHYKAMFESNRAVQLLVDPDQGKVLDANPAACEYYGYPPEVMKTLSISDLNGRSIGRVQEILEQIISGEITCFTSTAKTAQGQEREVEIYPSTLQAQGKLGIYLIIHDITERKQAEQLVQRQSQKIELLYEASRAFSSTLDLKVIYAAIHDFVTRMMACDSLFVSTYNPQEKLILGSYGWVDQIEIDASQLPPLPLEQEGHGIQSLVIRSGESLLLHDYDQFMEASAPRNHSAEAGKMMTAPPAQEHPRSGILVPLKMNGSVIGVVQVMSNKLSAFDVEQLHFLEALATHASSAITNARLYAELEKRFEERSVELAAANRELDAFTYSISHDLQAPVRGITGFTQILKESYTDCLPEEAQKYLNLIQANAQQMNQLTEGLLALSRLERHALNIQLVSPKAIVEQVLDELAPALKERQVKINLSELPPAKADPLMLRQVYLNLLSNALKFTRQRQEAVVEVGYLIHTPASSSLDPGEEFKQIVYYVRDNGIGFDTHYADHLFGVFQRLHPSQQFEGSGVGLSIVRRIITRHGGRVWAESEGDHGATFFFTLRDVKDSAE
jgi:PAS domain S-box-containing protein